MKIYVPNMYQKSVFDINYNDLKDMNIEYLIFDLDNTLGLINDVVCNSKTRDFINELSKSFTIIIASNNNYNRVSTFSKEMKVDIISMALKPSRKIHQIMKKKYTKNMSKVCMIGDQIVTDIIVGNRFGMLTILVYPLGEKDLKITSFNRFLEKKIINKMNFKRGEYYAKK